MYYGQRRINSTVDSSHVCFNFSGTSIASPQLVMFHPLVITLCQEPLSHINMLLTTTTPRLAHIQADTSSSEGCALYSLGEYVDA